MSGAMDGDANFAQRWWAHNRERSNFEDKLLDLGDDGFDFDRCGTDSYDSSIEIYGVPEACRLNEAQQRLLHDSGFDRAFVNHVDGVTETHYAWRAPFESAAGWRRRRTDAGWVFSSWSHALRSGMTVDPEL